MAEVAIDDIELSEDDKSQLESDFKELGATEPKKEEVDPVKSDDDDNHDDDDDSNDDDNTGRTPEEVEAIRKRRREERQQKKEWRKQKELSQQREIETLRKQLSEVNEWKNSVERRNVQSGVAALDQAIRDSEETLNLAKLAIKDATSNSDGDALVEAQELYYAARKRGEDLNKVKQNIARAARAGSNAPSPVDPMVRRNAEYWMKEKAWFDPMGSDEDSFITTQIDNRLAAEGWDPRTEEYWAELDGRLKKYLPHRFTNSGGVSYSSNSSPTRKDNPPTGGSSQDGPRKSTQYSLSPERVKAMKEAGYWDDPEKRKRMIKRYMDLDKVNRK